MDLAAEKTLAGLTAPDAKSYLQEYMTALKRFQEDLAAKNVQIAELAALPVVAFSKDAVANAQPTAQPTAVDNALPVAKEVIAAVPVQEQADAEIITAPFAAFPQFVNAQHIRDNIASYKNLVSEVEQTNSYKDSDFDGALKDANSPAGMTMEHVELIRLIDQETQLKAQIHDIAFNEAFIKNGDLSIVERLDTSAVDARRDVAYISDDIDHYFGLALDIKNSPAYQAGRLDDVFPVTGSQFIATENQLNMIGKIKDKLDLSQHINDVAAKLNAPKVSVEAQPVAFAAEAVVTPVAVSPPEVASATTAPAVIVALPAIEEGGFDPFVDVTAVEAQPFAAASEPTQTAEDDLAAENQLTDTLGTDDRFEDQPKKSNVIRGAFSRFRTRTKVATALALAAAAVGLGFYGSKMLKPSDVSAGQPTKTEVTNQPTVNLATSAANQSQSVASPLDNAASANESSASASQEVGSKSHIVKPQAYSFLGKSPVETVNLELSSEELQELQTLSEADPAFVGPRQHPMAEQGSDVANPSANEFNKADPSFIGPQMQMEADSSVTMTRAEVLEDNTRAAFTALQAARNDIIHANEQRIKESSALRNGVSAADVVAQRLKEMAFAKQAAEDTLRKRPIVATEFDANSTLTGTRAESVATNSASPSPSGSL